MTTLLSPNITTSPAETATVTPRAEFRVFGQGIIGEIQPRLWNSKTVLSQARPMPPETYFLSRHTTDASVKVREGLLDIKVKIGVTPEGYEIFRPTNKFQFPITADQAATVAAKLHVQLPESVAFASAVAFDAFLAMACAHKDLVPVLVEKMRWGFSIDGVICEYARVFFNGAMVESASVESECYAAMREVIETLGLSGRPNVNYIAAAGHIVGVRSPGRIQAGD